MSRQKGGASRWRPLGASCCSMLPSEGLFQNGPIALLLISCSHPELCVGREQALPTPIAIDLLAPTSPSNIPRTRAAQLATLL